MLEQGWALVALTASQAQAINDTVEAASEFFQLPLATKLECRLGPNAGFRPYGIEYSKSRERPDEMETFSTMFASRGIVYPVEPAQRLADQSLATFHMLEGIAEAMLIELAQVVTGKSRDEELRGGLRSSSTLQINYARPNQAKSPYTNEVHEDGHFLTLAFATKEGLEIKQCNGDFIPAYTLPGQLVVMLGETASLMTDGRLRPLFHQVRPPPDCPVRISVLFFADLAAELCQPWIVGETNRSVDISAFIKTIAARFGLQKCGSD